jgi:hypothetical protein
MINGSSKNERVCNKCSTTQLVVRRKAKPAKKPLRPSVVVKSTKPLRNMEWDNTAPALAQQHSPIASITRDTENENSSCAVDDEDLEHETVGLLSCQESDAGIAVAAAGHIEDNYYADHECNENDLEDEEDLEEIINKGVMCILPPSLYSFMFGESGSAPSGSR